MREQEYSGTKHRHRAQSQPRLTVARSGMGGTANPATANRGALSIGIDGMGRIVVW